MPRQSRTAKTIILSIGSALASVSGLAATIVLVRLFSKEDFATFRQTLLVFGMVSPFLGMGLAQSVVYFIPTATKKRQGAIVLEAVGPLLLAGLFYFFLMLLGGSRVAAHIWNNPKLEHTLIIMAPIAILTLPRSILAPSLIAREKVFLAAVLGVVSGLSVASVSTLVTLFVPLVEVTLLSQVLIACAIFVISLIVLLKNFSFEKPEWGGLKKQFAFGLPLCLSTAVTIISRNMDRAMVSSLCSLDSFAIFDRGAFELPLVGVVTGSMTTVLLVDYRTLYEEGRTDEMLRLLHRSAAKSALVLMPAMCILFALAPELITCMFGESYRESYQVFRVYLLLLPNRTIVFASVALAAGKTKELAMASIWALVANFVLTYLAISILGYIGGAVATIIVIYCVSGFLRATIAKNALGCSMAEFLPIKVVLKLIGLSIIPLIPVYICLYIVGDISPIFTLMLGVPVYIFGLILVYWNRGYVSPKRIVQRFLSFNEN